MKESDIARLFSRIPTLETERLILRRIKCSDAYDMYDYSCRSDVTEYLLWSPHPSLEYTKAYVTSLQSQYRKGCFYDWAIILRDENKMIGTVGYTEINAYNNSAELGYVINPHFWRRGIATEAVRALIEFGFNELNFNRIYARYMVGNDNSRRVMEKCGMSFEGIHRSLLFVKNEYRDIGICAILSSDFNKGSGCAYKIARSDSIFHSIFR